MSEPILSPLARQDLYDILSYIEHDSPRSAFQVIDRILSKCEQLAEFPRLGSPCDNLRENLRSSIVTPYVIYYVPTEKTVRIERVLHGALNQPAALADD